MSYYKGLFDPPKEGVNSFLWKINSFGEIVVEHLPPDANGIVNSARGFSCMGNVGDSNFAGGLNEAIKGVGKGNLRIVAVPHLHVYGVTSAEQLAEKLNAKGTNKTKTIWRAMPSELSHPSVVWDNEASAYVTSNSAPAT